MDCYNFIDAVKMKKYHSKINRMFNFVLNDKEHFVLRKYESPFSFFECCKNVKCSFHVKTAFNISTVA